MPIRIGSVSSQPVGANLYKNTRVILIIVLPCLSVSSDFDSDQNVRWA